MTDKPTEQELRELDEWIAEHVFGLKLNTNGMIETWPTPEIRHDLTTDNYTTNPTAAMEVLKKCLQLKGISDSAISFIGGQYWFRAVIVRDGRHVHCEGIHKNECTAICLFAKRLFEK